MPKRTKSYEPGLHERLRDPVYAMNYLRAALEDDDEYADAVFLLALRDVATANHMTYIAEATGLNRESLYKMLSRRGNPGLNSLKAVLNAIGLKLSVELAAPAQACGIVSNSTMAHTVYVEVSNDPLAAGFSYENPQPEPRPLAARLAGFAQPPPPRTSLSDLLESGNLFIFKN
jgi:probable addiction module antidote protein